MNFKILGFNQYQFKCLYVLDTISTEKGLSFNKESNNAYIVRIFCVFYILILSGIFILRQLLKEIKIINLRYGFFWCAKIILIWVDA